VRADVPGSVAKMSVSGSSASNNGYGFYSLVNSGTSGIMIVAASKSTFNVVGFGNDVATFRSAGNNLVNENNTNVTGAITTIGTL
jgi:hypothetical protein